MYNKTIPRYAEIMTVYEFKQYVKSGAIIDYDGFGNPVRDHKMSAMTISASQVDKIPADATHMAWYNR